jgi:hypothetical protein
MPVLNAAYSSLDDRFKPVVKEILTKLEAKGYQPIVCEGRRTTAQQAEKVKKGYSKTMKSYHLTGMAADIVDKRYMWNISNVHQFWWDLYEAAKSSTPATGHLRYGMIWDDTARAAIYKKALDTKKPSLVTWFCDVAHIELRV